MTFLELAEKVLSEQQKPLTASEIWNIAVENGYEKQLKSQGKTPDHTLMAQLYVNLNKDSKSIFLATDERPKRFYLKSQKDISFDEIKEETNHKPKSKKEKEYLEKDLHPFLTYFAYHSLNCYTKTINHSQSTKKGYGEWVHPDMVGCYFSFKDLDSEVYELSTAMGNNSSKLLSFELKRELNLNFLRESFFQTVSNSSWANESYLAAAEISNDTEFMNELNRLSSSFGIGIIKLNIKNPNESEIILPAKFRENLDWKTINKLLKMNSDFKRFLDRIKKDLEGKEVREDQYDPIYDEKELLKIIKKNKK